MNLSLRWLGLKVDPGQFGVSMSTKSAFSVTKALSSAVAFLPRAIGGAWLSLALLLALTVGGHHLVHHFQPHKPIGMAVLLALYVLKLIALGALYRIALFGKTARQEGLGFGGVQFGLPELRLFVANIVVVLFVVVIVIALFIVFAVAFETSGLAVGYANTRQAVMAMLCRHTTFADGIVIAYVVAAFILLVFVAIKFTLVHAATVAEHRIVTLNAMGLSSGNVGKLFTGAVILLLPFVAVWLVILHLSAPQVGQAHLLPVAWSTHQVRIAIHMLMQGLNVILLLPLLAGFFASAYMQIKDNRAR